MTRTVFVNSGPVKYVQSISVGPHLLAADEPAEFGGADAGPNPYELLLAALGACTSMTVRMYAERHNWPLKGVHATLTYGRVHLEDCAECDSDERLTDGIQVELLLDGDLSAEQERKLMEIAEKCPVHRRLSSPIPIRTRLAQTRLHPESGSELNG